MKKKKLKLYAEELEQVLMETIESHGTLARRLREERAETTRLTHVVNNKEIIIGRLWDIVRADHPELSFGTFVPPTQVDDPDA